jgi:uncharacterized secreted protein with C-terminal beta-propeller domain
MSRRLVPLIGILLVAALGGAAVSSALKMPSAASVRPRSFGSCPALVSYAQRNLSRTHGVPEPPVLALSTTAAPTVGRVAGAAPAAAAASGADGSSPAAEAYSTTNNQEEGVDEPDLVKTDGSTIFTVSGTRVEAVSASGTPKLLGSLDLGANGYDPQLLLRGNRLIVISSQAPRPIPLPGPIAAAPSFVRGSPYIAYGAATELTEVNVADPAAMKVTQTLSIDGSFVDARQAGTSARIVISSAPRAIPLPALAPSPAGWVPTWRFRDMKSGRRFTRPVAACSDIRRPVDFSGLGMLSIVTLDFDKGLGAAHTDALMADAQIVYGSPTSLYVATQKWVNPSLSVGQLPAGQTTVIDKFDVTDPDTTTFVASGEVPGYLLNQFSMSESGQFLRVASTTLPIWWGVGVNGTIPQSQSYVTVLDVANGVLAPVGQVAGLGQGERITSVRFIGDTGYVVTYRQVDPLTTVDLSTPTAPRVRGQLELAGYSAYLHPVGDGRLLGVGTDVSSDNEPAGSQLELFDVSDPAAPKLLAKTLIGAGSSTQVTADHHAFLYWPATNLAVLPVQIYPSGVVTGGVVGGGVVRSGGVASPTPSSGFVGAIGYKLSPSGISELGRLVQDAGDGSTPTIERSVVVGSHLFTVSAAGVMSSSLDTLQRQAFVSFPT